MAHTSYLDEKLKEYLKKEEQKFEKIATPQLEAFRKEVKDSLRDSDDKIFVLIEVCIGLLKRIIRLEYEIIKGGSFF